MGKLTEKFEYDKERHRYTWSVVGDKGGVHVWVVVMPNVESWDPSDKMYGGIEAHYRAAPDYMDPDQPSHDHCWLLDAPCWHEGSSLQFHEHFVDELGLEDIERGNHEPFFAFARLRYRQWMESPHE